MENEIWKDIKDYEGYYQISNMGRVKSLKRIIPHRINGEYHIPEKILKHNIVAFGYHQVSLRKMNKRKLKYVHVLVMETFVGDKPEGYEVNHIDEDKSNNRLDNLEYLTRKENNNYGTRIERHKKKAINGKRSKKVKGTCIKTGKTIIFPSIAEAQRQGYGTSISEVCNGKRKSCNGYTWNFI